MTAPPLTPANVQGYFRLPTKPQNVANALPSPMSARIFLMGMPKVGKTTLAASWAPDKTLILDLQHGTDLLPGDHYVQHINTWNEFEQAIDLIAKGGHPFQTVVIDTIDLAYKLADQSAAASFGKVAAGEVGYNAGRDMAEGLFRRAIGKLLGCRGLGIWFIGHAKTITDANDNERFIPELDKRVQMYVTGECEHVFYAEKLGKKTVIHTQASPRFEIGTRLPLAAMLDMDARTLYGAMLAGIKTLAGKPDVESDPPGPTPEADVPAETEQAQLEVAA